mgnify:FL=1
MSVSLCFSGTRINGTTHVVGGLAEVTVGGERHDRDDSLGADAAIEGLADVGEIGSGHCVDVG